MSTLEESVDRLMRAAGKRMLVDISNLPQANRALLSWIASNAARSRLDVHVELDPLYELLHGDRNLRLDWQAEESEFSKAIRELAESSSMKPPSDVVIQFLEMERDAREMTVVPNSRQWRFHRELARIVSDPFPWVEAIIEANAPSSFLEPYVYRAIESSRARLDALLPRLFAVLDYRRLVVDVVLRLEQPDAAILEDVLEALPTIGKVDSFWLGRQQVPVPTMLRLLSHPDRSIRVVSAIAEWLAPPEGEIRPQLLGSWREAIILAQNEDSYHLGKILGKDAALAYEWCAARLSENSWISRRTEQTLPLAAKVLAPDQHLELLRKLTGETYDDEWFDCLLGEDIDLYAQWLQTAEDAVRLRPLDRHVGERWKQMARIALDAGATPAEVAQHCTPNHHAMRGPFSRYYLDRIPAFEELCTDPDERLHSAGRAGLAWAKSNATRELESERREEIDGF